MIALVDYGLGNIRAFANVYKNLNIPVIIATKPNHLNEADKIILPGVGSFDYAIQRLNDSGLRETLKKLVLNKGIPVLGICVGMQMLAKSSEEGKLTGLGWIDGEVKLFDKFLIPYKTRLPHMGWNSMTPIKKNGLLTGIKNESRFYFLHSYYFICKNNEDVISTTHYGITCASAINCKNIYGIQFHPEKSHQCGIQLLKNFALL